MFVGLEPIRPHLWKLELWRLGALKENIKRNSMKLIIDNIFFCADVIGKKGVTECEIIFWKSEPFLKSNTLGTFIAILL